MFFINHRLSIIISASSWFTVTGISFAVAQEEGYSEGLGVKVNVTDETELASGSS